MADTQGDSSKFVIIENAYKARKYIFVFYYRAVIGRSVTRGKRGAQFPGRRITVGRRMTAEGAK